ncbi:Ribosomal large subunit pseudouridine synthase D [Aliarcobacter thereius]|uniref:RNA pseudouridylate synthase n=2 Tax=Aliarcobacter thereius TaxID=544718 RepID=A0A1C0BA55_9BACT|nr:RluA family pseudouridine synthase [Aliarcobacter thereius]OCL88407.1 Ribosomal large subunit pseudouridine synthase D [Aliarcobacter thereius]OCL91897.1 Ribosomal large subunit pseudouridine synthase D [Aliarcobacter thereius]OCL95005.1 Ribosomal large subunit pseudouridine synthase D [Aliarcobacter thereius LMG 24486]OCM00453.1 Ribosomal large subunit pseudouridine synthase D [Aliarcobacter thereius]QBF15124.1 RNA pseudouridine synthase [Aliarcobacter thereius LMG 24486]
MAFTLKKYKAIKDKRIQAFLVHNLDIEGRIAQRLVSKGRVFDENMNSIKTGETIPTEFIFIALFEGHTRGLKPLLEFQDFAIFDKPTHLMVHPISKNTEYSLLDEIRYHFGENANLIHRIDAETSGLVIVGKNKKSEIELKDMFQDKKYHKSYLAIVNGKVKNEIRIDKALDREGLLIGVRMKVCSENEGGKESITIIKPIFYNKERDLTLIEAIPLTGRQHQIRVHLHSIGHTILGDPIYGVDDINAENYLNKTLSKEDRFKVTGSNRLWLHANHLEFPYKGITYKLYSKNQDILNQIM